MPDPASRAALVLDHDVAPELLGQMGGKRAAREVGRPAGGNGTTIVIVRARPGLLRAQAIVSQRQDSRHERKPG